MGRRKNLLDAVKVGFTLGAEHVALLTEWAQAEDRSMSAIVRRLISEERERLEGEGKS